jgi:3D (Asp-Asp-Asp) domain-containing protein/LysM repeat protein
MSRFSILRTSIFLTSALALGTGFSFSGQTVMAAQLPQAPYHVVAGDTLYSIAQLSSSSLTTLLKVNNFTSQTTIYPGESIALPFVYKVQSGDALWYLAHHYGTTIGKIKALNGLTSNVIYPGMTLLIARGSKLESYGTQNTAIAAVSTPIKAPSSTQSAASSINAVATAYDSTVASNGSWGAVDYFGDPLQFGDIAVDPSVIPLGSKVFISGYSDTNLPKGGFYATAVDTGGAIKGDKIDIYMKSTTAAIDFGVENVQVTVLKN